MLETDLVYLREVRIEDAEDMHEYCSNPDVTKMTTIPTYKSIDDAYTSINNIFLSRDPKVQLDAFAIVYKENNKMIGTIDCGPFFKENMVEVGYVLNKDYWNRGIMTELLKLYIRYLFDKCKVERIEISHLPENIGSRRVIEKNNFVFEGIRRGYLTIDGIKHDMPYYSLLKSDIMQ